MVWIRRRHGVNFLDLQLSRFDYSTNGKYKKKTAVTTVSEIIKCMPDFVANVRKNFQILFLGKRYFRLHG